MSIKKLKKITLYGLVSEKDVVLRGLQELGCLHLIPLTDNTTTAEGEVSEPQAAKEALSWLTTCPVKRREVRNIETIDADRIADEILSNKQLHRAASDHRDSLIKRIQEVRPWGDFSFPELNALDGMRLWFYVIPHSDMSALDDIEHAHEIVFRDQKNCYVVLLSREEPDQALLPVNRSHVGDTSLSELEHQLEEAEMKLEDVQGERESLTRWIYLISQIIARKIDRQSLADANTATLDDDHFFLMSGWMPEDQEPVIRAFIGEFPVALTIEEVEQEDAPPTFLEGSDATGGGGEAFSFFQLPGYRAWDPGNVVFYSFSLFFAMIMSDAAYSLMVASILFMFRGKMKQSVSGTRLLNLGYFMSALGVAWGVMIGSYFGVSPEESSLIGQVAFINLNDYGAMMKLSVFIGVAHLVIANLMTAWVNRPNFYALAPIGWAMIMGGGLSVWLGMSGDLPESFGSTIGPGIMIVGALLVFLFTSTRKVSSAKDLLMRCLDGLKAIYNVTSAFGDILSYMRLFALGLSGASLAMTFNSLAMDVLHSSPVTGVLFAGVILLLGHILNFALCIMSGVVHGMRLNVIEFVNWGLSDEGYPFKAFRKQED